MGAVSRLAGAAQAEALAFPPSRECGSIVEALQAFGLDLGEAAGSREVFGAAPAPIVLAEIRLLHFVSLRF
jgi:hypothetical protein